MMREWDEYMEDFVPDDMLQIVLEPKTEITLNEDAPAQSVYMRGAYYVEAPPGTKKKNKQVDFFIMDPSYKVVYSRRANDQGIFRFNTTKAGQYSFVFSNMKDRYNTKSI